MSNRRSRNDPSRDTAKDVILGLPPSGLGPRAPREGRMANGSPASPTPRGRQQPSPPQNRREPSPPQNRQQQPYFPQKQYNGPPIQPVPPIQHRPPEFVPPRGGGNDRALMEELAKMQNQLRNYQRQSDDALRGEQEARRRLEAALRANQDNVNRMGENVKNRDGSGGQQIRKQDIDDLRQKVSSLEALILRMQQDIGGLKGAVDRHTNDMMLLNNEVKNRPQIDPTKVAGNQQQVDGRMRELHGGIMQMRQQLDNEMGERRKADQEQAQNVQRLQQIIQDQDARKNQILQHLAREGQGSKAKMDEEAKRLNDKIGIITDQVTRNMMDNEQRLRDEMNQKFQTLDKAIRAELDARLQYERDIRAFIEDRWRTFSAELEDVKTTQNGDKAKNKERFQKVNEALAVMERHLEQGNKKVDRVVAAEIGTRKLHEKGLLSKLTEIEDKLGNYLGGMNQAIDDVKKGKPTRIPPNLDTDGLRREMEAVASDKHKLSMEGLLKLEEKMQRIEKGLNRDSRDLKDKLDDTEKDSGVDSASLAKLRQQLQKLDEMQEDIEKSHSRLKDKVERQLPQDLDELSAKLDNTKHQVHDRIDKEENERYLAVREMQEEINKMKQGGNRGGPPVAAAPQYAPSDQSAEHQVAIKKLAESVTTVKNVLDRKINEEVRDRKEETEKLGKAIDKLRGTKAK